MRAGPHNFNNYSSEGAGELAPGESGDQLFSCHGHQIDTSAKADSLVFLIPLFLGSLVANGAIIYVLRKHKHVINKVTQHYVIVFMVTDLSKVMIIVFPSIVRICSPELVTGWLCYSGYWLNLFLLQSSILSLALAAYDRIIVLRNNMQPGSTRNRLKNTFFFSFLIPISYMLFDVLYTKLYEANGTDQIHTSEQSSLCYDSKLGWCLTKSAPHDHEKVDHKYADVPGSKKAGVFICQAHIMTMLILMSQLLLQSGHANYKKMYGDKSLDGDYYLMLFALNSWLYLPSMFVTLIDSFTSAIFPVVYYEAFYVYFYMLAMFPCMFNVVPLLIAYRAEIFEKPATADKTPRYSPIREAPSEQPLNPKERHIEIKMERLEKIQRKISRLEVPTSSGVTRDFTSTGSASSGCTPESLRLVGGGEAPIHGPAPSREEKDKNYFDTISMGRGGDPNRSVIANPHALEPRNSV